MSSRNNSTRATCPGHIWLHEVTLAAIALGADAEGCRAHKARVLGWGGAGEPVWMAAESLAFLVRQGAVEARLEAREHSLRRVLRKGR